jgi:hypothetical protein
VTYASHFCCSVIAGDLLENYCYDDMNFARVLFCVSILLTFPLECFVAREVSISNLQDVRLGVGENYEISCIGCCTQCVIGVMLRQLFSKIFPLSLAHIMKFHPINLLLLLLLLFHFDYSFYVHSYMHTHTQKIIRTQIKRFYSHELVEYDKNVDPKDANNDDDGVSTRKRMRDE